MEMPYKIVEIGYYIRAYGYASLYRGGLLIKIYVHVNQK